ncbi:MAG TPA: toll/interleukin-1 receptor domain-containing protein [Roseiarcus sp.]|nr:toll/interleukin-1 receptor domain-containing protein [Roseiarcus sp.]
MPDSEPATRIEVNSEEFWDDLLAYVEDGRVVPVIGPELHTIVVEGREVPLYRALAEQLLKKYGLEACDADSPISPPDDQVPLRKHLELNDAVSGLSHRGKRVADLYRPINDELRKLLAAQTALPQPLSDLARITDFQLFVSTTFDDLVARAIDGARASGGLPILQIAYAPNLSEDQADDLPDNWSEKYRPVFYLFGRASSSPFFAIDDEDVLEFIHSLQAEKGVRPERLLAELRQRHLLLIGCNFADWLSRFFIRLANQVRLSGDRPKKEFLIGDEVTLDQSLTMFLERFSHNTRVYRGDPKGFIAELLRRWTERHPQRVAPLATTHAQAPLQPSQAGGVFISYAHEDVDAALALSTELKKIGAGVIWIDKTQLKPGDEWDAKINAAVKSCDLFLPLLSANTEAREEGYFHGEWIIADKRQSIIFGRSLVIPVIVDATFDPGHYRLIPDGFRARQFGHAPEGHMNEGLRNLMIDALRDLRRRRPE